MNFTQGLKLLKSSKVEQRQIVDLESIEIFLI